MVDKKEFDGKYGSKNLKVLEGLDNIGDIRDNFDVVSLSKRIKKRGDLLVLSQELKIRPRILESAVLEGRILKLLPNLEKSKASILSGLKTDREVKLFDKKYDLARISARNLRKLVIEWGEDIQLNPELLISDEEHDLIMGSLLGDSSVRKREKTSCFRFSHSIAQKDYAKWKAKILSNFNFSEFREVKRRIKNRFIHAIDFSTKTHSVFNYYRNLFYKNGIKKVTKELLDQTNSRSLAVWICDDGSFSVKQGYIILCTFSFSLEEHKLMKEFFNEKFELDPTIGFRDGKYYYLRFKQEDSKKLIEIIKPFIPSCMLYKIGGKNVKEI